MSRPYHIQYEGDHECIALSRLLQQHGDATRIRAYIQAVSKAIQTFEDALFAILDGATLINESTVPHALARWAVLVGERQGALTALQLWRVFEARVRANAVGTTSVPLTVAGFAALLELAFADAQVALTMFNAGTVRMKVMVTSPNGVLLPDVVAERGAAIAKRGVPLGVLLTIHEVADTGVVYGVPGRGYSPSARIGRSLASGVS